MIGHQMRRLGLMPVLLLILVAALALPMPVGAKASPELHATAAAEATMPDCCGTAGEPATHACAACLAALPESLLPAPRAGRRSIRARPLARTFPSRGSGVPSPPPRLS